MIRWTGRVKFVFLLPAVFWVLIFTAFPLGYSLVLSLNDVEQKVVITGREKVPVLDQAGDPVLRADGEPRTKTVVHREAQTNFTWNGGAHYGRAFRDQEVADAAWVTAIFVSVGVTVEIALGLFLAFLFNRRLVARSFLRTVMILPIFATPVAIAYVWITIYHEVAGPLFFLGVPWLSHPVWALASLIVVDIWQWTPFCFLVILAALQGIPEDLIECARLDSKSSWDLWRVVVLPMLQPIIIIVLLLRMAEAMKLFDIVNALTFGGPGNATLPLTYLAYTRGFKMYDFGYASAEAYLILIATMIIVILFFRQLRRTYA